jgi:hypothetical protein
MSSWGRVQCGGGLDGGNTPAAALRAAVREIKKDPALTYAAWWAGFHVFGGTTRPFQETTDASKVPWQIASKV